MPSRSKTRRMACDVLSLGSTTPCSKRITEFSASTALSANFWRVHPKNALAARASRGVSIVGTGIKGCSEVC